MTKLAYSFDAQTAVFTGVTVCDENPLHAGDFLLAANATWQEPPEATEGHERVFRDGAWQSLPDNRGQIYWLADGSEHTISEVGEEAPDDALDAAPDLRTLEERRAAKRQDVEGLFKAELDRGVEIDGRMYDCDETSQQRMTSAVTLAQTSAAAGLDFSPIDWTLKNNSVYTIATFDALVQIALAMGAHVQRLFAVRNSHKAAIEQFESAEAVSAYDAHQSWPERGEA